MSWKRKISGSILGFVGFMLSPLSWWNDLYVNLPLALAFAWVVGLFQPQWFTGSLIFGYWLTNVLGFVLMHKGVVQLTTKENAPAGKRELVKDVIISLLYTALIVALVKLGVLKPVEAYFKSR